MEEFTPNKTSKFYTGKLKLQRFAEQKVDVIVPFYGQCDRVVELVKSLIYNTKTNLFRVCVVDDHSPNRDFIETAFSHFPNVLEVRNTTRLGFGASLEVGAEALAAHGAFPWLVFLHSDCILEDTNWLVELGETMLDLKGQGVKMVSARCNNPVVQDARLWAAKGAQPKADVILDYPDFLPMYCTLCHRDLFKHIGGFVKHYPYAGYEDRELAARMHKYGFKQAISGKAWVYHEGEATLNYLKTKEPLEFDRLSYNRKLWEEDCKKMGVSHT